MIETIPSAKRPLVTGRLRFARTAICGLVFLLSGWIVYWTAARRTEAPKNYRATATIVQHAAAAHAADALAAIRPDSEAIRRQVLSDDSLRRIVAGSRPQPAPALTAAEMESIRGQLRFASPSDAAGSCLATISSTEGSPEQALRLVNAVARSYADAHRAAVAAMIAKANDQAAEAVRESRQRWQQAEAQRSEFLRQPAAVEPQPETPKASPVPAKPHWVANPQWTELQRMHDDLVRRRQELLVTRTPLHPEVLVVNDLIAQSQTKLASVPRRLPAGDTDAGTRPGATAGLSSSADAAPGATAGLSSSADAAPGATAGLSSSADAAPGATAGLSSSADAAPGATAGLSSSADAAPGATAGLSSSADAGPRRHGDAATVTPGGHAGMAGKELAQRNQQRLALDAAVQQARSRLEQALQTQRTSQSALAHAATIEVHPAKAL